MGFGFLVTEHNVSLQLAGVLIFFAIVYLKGIGGLKEFLCPRIN
jgi:hypothetical protein